MLVFSRLEFSSIQQWEVDNEENVCCDILVLLLLIDFILINLFSWLRKNHPLLNR